MRRLTRVTIASSLLWLLAILGYSCSIQHPAIEETVFEIVKTDSLTIDLAYPYNATATTCMQHLVIGKTNYLYTAEFDERKLLKFNLDAGTLEKVIDLKFLEKGRYLVFGFHVFSENNILIHRDVSNYRSASDSAFCLIDSNGNVTKRIPVSGNGLVEYGQPISPYALSLIHDFRPLYFYGDRLYFSPRPRYGATITEQQIDSAKLPRVIAFDGLNSGDTRIQISPFRNPHIKSGNYTHGLRNIFLEPINEDFVLVGYANNSVIYLVDFTTGKIIHQSKSNSSLLISEPIPAPSDYTGDISSYQLSSNFTTLLHDPIKNQNIRFANFAVNSELSKGDYRKFLRNEWFGVYDSSLQLLGQGLKPDWFKSQWPKPTLTTKGWLSIYQSKENRQILKVYYAEIIPTKNSLDSLQTSVELIKNVKSSFVLEDYPALQELTDNNIVLLVPEGSCPACINAVLNYYVAHIKEMEEQKIYLLTNSKQAKKLLADKHTSFIIQEETLVLENYLNTGIGNPMLFLWKDKKVSKAIVLNPNEAEQVDYFIQQLQKEL